MTKNGPKMGQNNFLKLLIYIYHEDLYLTEKMWPWFWKTKYFCGSNDFFTQWQQPIIQTLECGVPFYLVRRPGEQYAGFQLSKLYKTSIHPLRFGQTFWSEKKISVPFPLNWFDPHQIISFFNKTKAAFRKICFAL